jgi:hypothetical protein
VGEEALRGAQPHEETKGRIHGNHAEFSTGVCAFGLKFFPPPCHTAPGGLVFKVMEVSKRGLRGMRPGFGFAFKGLIVFAIA